MSNIWDSDLPTAGLTQPTEVEIESIGDGDQPHLSNDGKSLLIPTEDGGVVVDFAPQEDEDDSSFGANLALKMGDAELSTIAETLLQGIQADKESQLEWEATLDRGLDLLGLKLEEPRGDIGGSSAPIEGMSVVRHPIMAQAVLQGQATACGELLPAGGPAKVRNDNNSTFGDVLADALERDLNHYLTVDAPEYYPDTRRALFWSTFAGSAFKKVYMCPIRRRPVSETVNGKDVIVSNAATDLKNAPRVTHQILMLPSMMRRMQAFGLYRDIPLTQPSRDLDRVDEKVNAISGISARRDRPEDQPYTLYECYCELDLDRFVPRKFKGKKIPLPFRVTIEKDTRVVLDIRRNWLEDDEQCLPRRCLVKYPYVEGPELRGIGLLHILGNGDNALTAAWRIMLDNGMYANFPAGIVDRAAARQWTNEFRVAPGSMIQLDFGGRNAAQVYGQLPYRDLGPVFVQFIQQVEASLKQLGGAAEMQVGDGRQDAPVGTTIALIEQATKIQSEVHKGLHAAQAEELELLKELFAEDPAALWRNNPHSAVLQVLMQRPELQGMAQQQEQAEEKRRMIFVAALNQVTLVPQSDPNTPSHTHRLMKTTAMMQVVAGDPAFNQVEAKLRALKNLGVSDAESLLAPPPMAPPQPDPMLLAAQAKIMDSQTRAGELQLKTRNSDRDAQLRAAEISSEQQVAQANLVKETIIHQNDTRLRAAELVKDHIHKTADRDLDSQHRHLDRFIKMVPQPPQPQ